MQTIVRMRWLLCCALVVSVLGAGCSSESSSSTKAVKLEPTVVGDGVITGRVLLEGTPPPERELPLDPNCKGACKLHYGEEVRYTRLFVTKDGGLGDVLVTLVDIEPQPLPAGVEPLVIDQTGCEYTPYVAACQVGQPIEVRNNDPLMHNVHTLPQVSGNKEVNKSQAQGSAPLKFVYEKPEQFLRFKCDVHPWMFAYISVLEHPFFDVTDEAGGFEIKGLPDGVYKVKFAHRKAGEVVKEVEVKDGKGSVDVTFQVPSEQ